MDEGQLAGVFKESNQLKETRQQLWCFRSELHCDFALMFLITSATEVKRRKVKVVQWNGLMMWWAGCWTQPWQKYWFPLFRSHTVNNMRHDGGGKKLVNFNSRVTHILTLCKYAFGWHLFQGDTFAWIAMRYHRCTLHSGGGYPLPFICTQVSHTQTGVSCQYVHADTSNLSAGSRNGFTRCTVVRHWDKCYSKQAKQWTLQPCMNHITLRFSCWSWSDDQGIQINTAEAACVRLLPWAGGCISDWI